MSNATENELDWYFNVSESACGISSSYYAMINSNPGKPPSENPEKIIFYIPKIRKHRKIHNKLQRLSKTELRQLTATHDQTYRYKYPQEISNVFQELTGVLLTLTHDQETLTNLCKKYRQKTISEENRQAINALKLQARTTLNKIYIKYAQL